MFDVTVEPLVTSFLSGISSSLMAYGQISTGKSSLDFWVLNDFVPFYFIAFESLPPYHYSLWRRVLFVQRPCRQQNSKRNPCRQIELTVLVFFVSSRKDLQHVIRQHRFGSSRHRTHFHLHSTLQQILLQNLLLFSANLSGQNLWFADSARSEFESSPKRASERW